MSNILYLGPYRENNGYGRSSRRFLNCLKSNKSYNIKSIPIYQTQNTIFNEQDIHLVNFDSTEQADYHNYDCIIQHGNPMLFQYHKKYGKNIGITEIDTIGTKHTGLIERINLLDEIIVHSLFSAKILEESGVVIPIKIIPQPYNIDTDMVNSDFFTYSDKPYIFYHIGQFEEKNNILSAIMAFLLEFDEDENVKFFIKTGDYNKNNEIIIESLKNEINKIISIIRHKKIKSTKIDILCGTIPENDILRLHKSADCYVNTVRTDNFGPSAIESGIFGKNVINTKHIGSNSYISSINGLLVDAEMSSVCSSSYFYKNYYTVFEKWYEPNIESIREKMRKAYNSRNICEHVGFKNIFSYNNISGLII